MSTPRCTCPLCRAHDEILARNVAQVEARIEEIATSGEKVFDARRHNAMVEHTTDRIFVKALDPFFHADPDWEIVSARPTGRVIENRPEVVIVMRWKGAR